MAGGGELKQLVGTYFAQLTKGCEDESCSCLHCVRGGAVEPLKPNGCSRIAMAGQSGPTLGSLGRLDRAFCLSVAPFFLVFSLPVCGVWGLERGGAWGWALLLFAFVGVPLGDALLPLDKHNPTRAEARVLESRGRFRLPLYVWFVAQPGFLVWALRRHASVYGSEYLALVVSIGLLYGSLGITIAHELVHKRGSRMDQAAAKLMLVQMLYGHWVVEHVLGHHKRVATREDPATGRLGEGFWRFLPRTLLGQFASAWEIERERLARKGRWAFGPHNVILQLQAASAVLLLVLYAWGGWSAVVFQVEAAFIGVLLLELVNYVEHYGLLREITSAGRPEPVSPLHSWNASHRLSNWLLFKLQRHSDHHAFGGRRYQVLRTFENSPTLPAGYPAMILLALLPPLWFWVMDRRVEAARERQREWKRTGLDPFPTLRDA